MAKEPTIVFVHIPKNAGTTLHSILEERYQNVYHLRGTQAMADVNTFKALSVERQNSFEVVKGHLSLELIPYIEKTIAITYLRDPVDRFISSYFYLKRATWSRAHEDVKKMKDITEFIDYSLKLGIDNVQTRHLSGDVKHFMDHELVPTDFSSHGETLLLDAKKNLQNIDFVFLTQQFDASLLILKKELHWEKYPLYLVLNKTEKRKKTLDFDEETIKKIQHLNRFDMELYETAKGINKKLMMRYDLESDLKAFQIKNKNHQSRSQNSTFIELRKIKGKIKKTLGF